MQSIHLSCTCNPCFQTTPVEFLVLCVECFCLDRQIFHQPPDPNVPLPQPQSRLSSRRSRAICMSKGPRKPRSLYTPTLCLADAESEYQGEIKAPKRVGFDIYQTGSVYCVNAESAFMLIFLYVCLFIFSFIHFLAIKLLLHTLCYFNDLNIQTFGSVRNIMLRLGNFILLKLSTYIYNFPQQKYMELITLFLLEICLLALSLSFSFSCSLSYLMF